MGQTTKIKTNPEGYDSMTKEASHNSKAAINIPMAFLVGGLICCIGQAFSDLYQNLGMSLEKASTLTSVTLIFLSILATGLHLYDNLAKHAGAGTLVPITGFANAVASPAIEFKSEGLILGVGAKLFSIAGPVIVYGTAAACIYGIIYYFVDG